MIAGYVGLAFLFGLLVAWHRFNPAGDDETVTES